MLASADKIINYNNYIDSCTGVTIFVTVINIYLTGEISISYSITAK